MAVSYTHLDVYKRQAQQILVMKHGVLVGKGTHETLLEGCPEYARLWNACVCAENWSMGGDADV